VLEGHKPTRKTQLHLDRCLTCRACETTCPSGVEYAKLAEIGRDLVDQQVQRPPRERLMRWSLRHVVAYRRRFAFFYHIGQLFRPLLVGPLRDVRQKLPPKRTRVTWPEHTGEPRTMLIFDGCV